MTATVTAFAWVPPFAQGFVRDHRVRWAHEEMGVPYEVELVDSAALNTPEHRARQPFGQVPAYRDGPIEMFESGAILMHLAAKSEALAPRDPAGFAQVQAWAFAALSSVEPRMQAFANLDSFNGGAAWVEGYRPVAEAALRGRLAALETWLAGRDYLAGSSSAADILMATVLCELEESGILAGYPSVQAYLDRCQDRPAWKRALAAQLATFAEHAPKAAEPA